MPNIIDLYYPNIHSFMLQLCRSFYPYACTFNALTHGSIPSVLYCLEPDNLCKRVFFGAFSIFCAPWSDTYAGSLDTHTVVDASRLEAQTGIYHRSLVYKLYYVHPQVYESRS